MKYSLILLFLIIIGLAITGLFFGYNKGYLNKPADTVPNTDNEAINEPSDVPAGDPGLKKQVKVDLTLQKAFLYENGNFVREFTVSSGKPDTPTPKGKFMVIHKQDMLYSKLTECWLGFWVGFEGDYGFHETPVCDGKRVGEDKMGQPDSAGCLRLKLGDAEQFYNWAEINTAIEIY